MFAFVLFLSHTPHYHSLSYSFFLHYLTLLFIRPQRNFLPSPLTTIRWAVTRGRVCTSLGSRRRLLTAAFPCRPFLLPPVQYPRVRHPPLLLPPRPLTHLLLPPRPIILALLCPRQSPCLLLLLPLTLFLLLRSVRLLTDLSVKGLDQIGRM